MGKSFSTSQKEVTKIPEFISESIPESNLYSNQESEKKKNAKTIKNAIIYEMEDGKYNVINLGNPKSYLDIPIGVNEKTEDRKHLYKPYTNRVSNFQKDIYILHKVCSKLNLWNDIAKDKIRMDKCGITDNFSESDEYFLKLSNDLEVKAGKHTVFSYDYCFKIIQYISVYGWDSFKEVSLKL